MTFTENAANRIAAHGQHFREDSGIPLQYSLHDHLSYDHTAGLQPLHDAYCVTQAIKDDFEAWFPPLLSLKTKTAMGMDQPPALF